MIRASGRVRLWKCAFPAFSLRLKHCNSATFAQKRLICRANLRNIGKWKVEGWRRVDARRRCKRPDHLARIVAMRSVSVFVTIITAGLTRLLTLCTAPEASPGYGRVLASPSSNPSRRTYATICLFQFEGLKDLLLAGETPDLRLIASLSK